MFAKRAIDAVRRPRPKRSNDVAVIFQSLPARGLAPSRTSFLGQDSLAQMQIHLIGHPIAALDRKLGQIVRANRR